MLATVLLAVPNVSEGREAARIERLAAAFTPARLLDVHADRDHNRSVFTLAGEQGEVSRALVAGARAAAESIDLSAHDGLHPHVGALDVAPVVYLADQDRGAAIAEALTAATLIGELGIPVFLYGQLATQEECRERADVRRGGPVALRERIASGAPIAEAELVGLAPAAALADFPDDVPLRNRRTIEDATLHNRSDGSDQAQAHA